MQATRKLLQATTWIPLLQLFTKKSERAHIIFVQYVIEFCTEKKIPGSEEKYVWFPAPFYRKKVL